MVALSGLNARATYGTRTTADEPQYLLTALSLAEDFDLDISGELAEDRFLDFHELPLNPQTIELDEGGQRLSPHDPLLPLILAVPMGLGGWALAKATMALLAAASAAATAWLCFRRFRVSTSTAALVTTALFSAPPLVGYGSQVYPEMAAALAVACGLGAVTGIASGARAPAGFAPSGIQLIGVTTVVALPWLSVKYAAVAAVLASALLIRSVRRSRSQAAVLVGMLSIAGLVYLIVHQRIYGGWTVYAAGDHFVGGELQVVGSDPDYLGRSRRLIGLLVDREFGIAAWAPAYIAALPALSFLVRHTTADRSRDRSAPDRSAPDRSAADRRLLVIVVAAGWAVATWVALTMHGWWWPGRQIVSILPAVVVAIAVLVDGHNRLRLAVVGASLVGTFGWLWVVVEVATGRRALIVDFAQTANPIYRLWSQVLPDHVRSNTVDALLTAAWGGILLGLALLAVRHVAADEEP